jgi:hypothetical protein
VSFWTKLTFRLRLSSWPISLNPLISRLSLLSYFYGCVNGLSCSCIDCCVSSASLRDRSDVGIGTPEGGTKSSRIPMRGVRRSRGIGWASTGRRWRESDARWSKDETIAVSPFTQAKHDDQRKAVFPRLTEPRGPVVPWSRQAVLSHSNTGNHGASTGAECSLGPVLQGWMGKVKADDLCICGMKGPLEEAGYGGRARA